MTSPRGDTARTLCLFGGAFNPPHLTHARVVRAALDQLDPDELVVLPSGQHPHKQDTGMAPAEVRLELCQLAFAGIDRVRVDDWEIRQPGLSYTVETVRHFRECTPGESRPYWIIGSDNLALLPTWHRSAELLELAILVTCPRADHPVTAELVDELGIGEAQKDEIMAHVLQIEPDAVSASAIRDALVTGASTEPWLHPEVAARIRALGLYGAKATDA